MVFQESNNQSRFKYVSIPTALITVNNALIFGDWCTQYYDLTALAKRNIQVSPFSFLPCFKFLAKLIRTPHFLSLICYTKFFCYSTNLRLLLRNLKLLNKITVSFLPSNPQPTSISRVYRGIPPGSLEQHVEEIHRQPTGKHRPILRRTCSIGKHHRAGTGHRHR